MTTLTGPAYVSDWLKGEDESTNGRFSRDRVTLVAGYGPMPTGRVLGQITASGKYTSYNPGNSDGSQTAIAVLIDPTDTTSADQTATIISRHAVVSHNALSYDASVTTPTQRATVATQLAAKGIVGRQTN